MNNQNYFIDKLNMSQQYAEKLPIFSKEIRLSIDTITGKTIRDAHPVGNHVHEGSYSTKINIYCDSKRVIVTGNPSRYNRPDNLYGFETIDECVSVYNSILSELGLPSFAKQIGEPDLRLSQDGKTTIDMTTCARFNEIHFTKNISVGEGNEIPFIMGMSSQVLGKRRGFLYPNGNTAQWGKPDWLREKIYNKAVDLRRHRKVQVKLYGEGSSDLRYYDDLIQFCEQHGIVRQESEFKAKYLKRHNLHLYGTSIEKNYIDHIKFNEIYKVSEINHMKYETISEQLIEKGICKSSRSANPTESIALKWMHGMQLERNSQFYIYQKRLRNLGMDISTPYDITRLPPTITSSNNIVISEKQPPHWYRKPTTKHLRLVA